MDIGQLEAFVAVVREGSFTRAARRLNLTQPSLSARIRQLELQLDATLFQRDRRPVQLTRTGELFLGYAERALGILEAGEDAIAVAQTGKAGRVHVCCPVSMATYLMPQVVHAFTQRYPLAELFVETGHSEFAVRQLLDGLVDLALAAAFPRFLEQTQLLLLMHDEMVVAGNAADFAGPSPRLELQELWRYQVLLIHWGKAFAAYAESLRQMADPQGSTTRVPLAVALPMLQQAQVVAFVPRRLAEVAGLAIVEVPGFRFSWDTVLITRLGHALTPLEEAFVHLVRRSWRGGRD